MLFAKEDSERAAHKRKLELIISPTLHDPWRNTKQTAGVAGRDQRAVSARKIQAPSELLPRSDFSYKSEDAL